jgi:uncharacterized membrane protein
MKTHRLDQLADGIFAIIMTLLAFEIKPPPISAGLMGESLWHSLINMSGSFFILFITFALLFTYWRGHHFIVSTYAQNLTAGLINYNALFFFLITLVPFSSRLLGSYYNNRISIIVYGINVILIGLTLFFMRRYIEKNPTIETIPVGRDEVIGGYVRILLPVVSAFVAIILSFWNTSFSLLLFSLAIVFNLIPGTTRWIHRHAA